MGNGVASKHLTFSHRRQSRKSNDARLQKWPTGEAEITRRRELTLRYRALLAEIEGIIVPFDEADVPSSSCYVMPIMLEEDGRQAEVSDRLRENGIQTSIFYPAIHRFTAYRKRFPDVSLPITELASRTELTLPFYPHMSNHDQDRVAAALAEAVAR